MSDDNKSKRKPNGFEQRGGYMASKMIKLNNQFEKQDVLLNTDEESTNIFEGIAIFVNGYTKPSSEELRRLMYLHGGIYHHFYYPTETTHVVASNLPKSKMKNLKNQIVVTADWITQSIKAGKLLPHHDFLLYTPEAVDEQQRLQFGKPLEMAIECNSDDDYEEEYEDPFTSFRRDLSEMINISEDEFERLNEENVLDLEKALRVNMSTLVSCSKNSNAASNNYASVCRKEPRLIVTAGRLDFLNNLYPRSRLHHISTSIQDLKQRLQHVSDSNRVRHFPRRERLRIWAQENLSSDPSLFPDSSRTKYNSQDIIMHLDMDCFFVSVGLRKHPELRGLPVAVAHSTTRRSRLQEGTNVNYEAVHGMNKSMKNISGLVTAGSKSNQEAVEAQNISKYSKEYGSFSEIACCSYEARKAGVRNGMLLGEALRCCPELRIIPYDFEGYTEVSEQLYNIVSSYTLDIEAVSCDELYINCTELLQDVQLSPYQFSTMLREEINKETGCTVSAGLGCNMLLARLATKVAKPNGQFHVCEPGIEEFVGKQVVEDLPGVGYSTSLKLKQLDIVTCGDMQALPIDFLKKKFGDKTGLALYKHCRGKDDRVVKLQQFRKSVSTEINYGIRFETIDEAYNFIHQLADELHNRLQRIGCKGNVLTLKLMVRRPDAPVETAKFMGHGACNRLCKSVLLKSATNSAKVIANECCTLARALNIKPQDYRGLGIQMRKLESAQQEKSTTTMESFCNRVTDESDDSKIEKFSTKFPVLSPPTIEIVETPIPNKSTIKHFLFNKSSPQKKSLYDTEDYVLEKLDQSVLNALPEELRKEVLENCTVSTIPISSVKSATSVNPSNSKEKNSSTSSMPKLKHSAFSKPMLENKGNSCDDFSVRETTRGKVSLGGAVEVDEIRNLLKEWVNSTKG